MIGKGDSSCVYKCKDITDQRRHLAIKISNGDQNIEIKNEIDVLKIINSNKDSKPCFPLRIYQYGNLIQKDKTINNSYHILPYFVMPRFGLNL